MGLDAALLDRVGAEGVAPALAEPHTEPMTLGGRRLAGFVLVRPDGVADAAALRRWVDAAVGAVGALAPREPAQEQ